MRKLIDCLDAFNRACAAGARFIACACIAFMITIVFCGVVWRYLLKDALSWVDEVAALTLVVISFLGCYLAMHKHKLARIDLLISMFEGRAKTAAYVISECASLAMLLVVIYYGAQLFLLPTSLRQRTPGTYIPLWIFYGLIPFTFFMNAIVSATDILHYVFDGPKRIGKETGREEAVSP
ncbi:MAG: TRAP transporter small permease [Planctomycetota bacterium]|jgi:TRAP-type C4-dicarboxylate transport system permease small subunit|nr:TRAP transporter small permease [Planctomycetota bacterium]